MKTELSIRYTLDAYTMAKMCVSFNPDLVYLLGPEFKDGAEVDLGRFQVKLRIDTDGSFSVRTDRIIGTRCVEHSIFLVGSHDEDYMLCGVGNVFDYVQPGLFD